MLKRSIICSTVLAILLFIAIPVTASASGGSAVIGTAPSILVSSGKQNGLYEECTLGDALADAMVRFTDADLAIVNGGCLKGNILQGDVTEAHIEEAIEDCDVVMVTVSPRDLFDMLEICLSHVVTDGKRDYDAAASEHPSFPQVSGLRVTYDPSAEPYARISRVTIDDKAVQADDDRALTVAVPAPLRDGDLSGIGADDVGTGETLVSLMKKYVSSGMDDYYTPPKRIIPQGIHSSVFPDRYAVILLLAVCGVLFALLLPLAKKLDLFKSRKDLKRSDEREDPEGSEKSEEKGEAAET